MANRLWILLLVLFPSNAHACQPAMSQTRMNTVMEKLFQLSAQGTVNDEDLSFLRADKQIESNVYFQKASVGIVEGDTFIVFNSDRNKLQIRDDIWTGKGKSEPEILFYKNSKLLIPASTSEAKRSGAIVFSKDNVWVIQPAENCAGRYARTPM
ncbi:hypothetical protein O8B93_27415 [Agrobacterium rhizogenes]|uniref:hypothetical protein n=1 Tax=Rhizobium rhizogenes TaxID=359 RepID=UPI0022B73E9E|nr:hypothetical protein [Rhizobium rhizogenes]MCZ7451296.1 hypothetical protein [Rhizobium rhizogenes]